MKSKLILVLVALLALSTQHCSPKETMPPGTPSSTPQEAARVSPKSLSETTWPPQWDKWVGEAKKEGQLVIYALTSPTVRQLFMESFKRDFGIEVEVHIAQDLENLQKLERERRAGLQLADLYMTGSTTMVSQLKPQELIDPISPILIMPEVTNPAAWYGGKGPIFVDTEKKYIVAMQSYPVRNVYVNTEIVRSGEVKSFRDLLDSKWKGSVIMADPTIPGPGGAFIMLVTIAIPELGRDYLRELAKQEPAVMRDRRLSVEWLARGRKAIGLGLATDLVAEFISAGAPVSYLELREGTMLVSGNYTIALLKNHPHPNAARVFLNWLLSPKIQDLLGRATLNQSARVDIATDYLPREKIRVSGESYFIREQEDVLLKETELRAFAKEVFAAFIK